MATDTGNTGAGTQRGAVAGDGGVLRPAAGGAGHSPLVRSPVLVWLDKQALIASDVVAMATRYESRGGVIPEAIYDIAPKAQGIWLRAQLNAMEHQFPAPQLERQRHWRVVFGSQLQKRWFAE